MSTRGWLVAAGALLLGLAAGAGGGLYADQQYPDSVPVLGFHVAPGQIDTGSYQQAIRVLRAHYYDSKLDYGKLSQGSIKGMVDSLGDPYSRYLSPDQFKNEQLDLQGKHTGLIGVTVNFDGEYPVIASILPNSPAQKAGVEGGDVILTIGGKDAHGLKADAASALIRGPQGSAVELGLRRSGQLVTVTVTRDQFISPSVVSQRLEGEVLYIRIYQFGDATAAQFDQQLKAGLPGAKGVVLDLRDNPGGLVSAAANVLSQFISSGELFEVRDSGGHIDRTVPSGDHPATSVPLYVLLNGSSASASEIVSGSLQQRARGTLVGAKSFGKGSVQVDYQLSDGSDLHLTVQHWFLADGRSVIKNPLIPDQAVTLAKPTDMYDVAEPAHGHSADSQLNRALELIAAR